MPFEAGVDCAVAPAANTAAANPNAGSESALTRPLPPAAPRRNSVIVPPRLDASPDFVAARTCADRTTSDEPFLRATEKTAGGDERLPVYVHKGKNETDDARRRAPGSPKNQEPPAIGGQRRPSVGLRIPARKLREHARLVTLHRSICGASGGPAPRKKRGAEAPRSPLPHQFRSITDSRTRHRTSHHPR